VVLEWGLVQNRLSSFGMCVSVCVCEGGRERERERESERD